VLVYLLAGLAVALVHAALVLLLERILTIVHLPAPWRYRMAFLFSSGFTLIPWISNWFLVHPAWVIFTGVGGAFLGGLAATTQVWPLWENNAPPSVEIQRNVLLIHRKIIPTETHNPPLKRVFDLMLAASALLILSPVWIIISFLIWFEDPGPILFVKNSVGKGGVTFHQYKFRTMVLGAENATGPILASIQDMRVLHTGRLLRKIHLDELPQLVNVVKGDMSFVGPRPQRTVLVYSYLQKMPEYAERHRVLPGIAGLAQVAGSYYVSPRQKLRFDRLYIQHRSLGFDLKLLCLACLVAFWYRWNKGWNGRLPRRLLH
jgi:lipopolysaccharide/colanic/teichoic acid biosynthesis glycosyltransferase